MLTLANILLPLMMLHSFHAVHISYGDLTVSRDSILGEVTFYKDDWTRATERWYGHSINTAQLAFAEREYLVSHLRFWINDVRNPVSFQPIVKEDAGLSVTYRFAVRAPASMEKLIVDSRAIFSEYNDQLNLMTAKVGARTQNLMLTSEHPTAIIKL